MTHRAAFWFPFWLGSIGAVLVRPQLWFAALRQLGRAAPARWWARPPFVPLPDRGYVRFRLETAYGAGGRPHVPDVVRYLEWCRACG